MTAIYPLIMDKNFIILWVYTCKIGGNGIFIQGRVSQMPTIFKIFLKALETFLKLFGF